jgi:GGDEF domain-containing protein
LRADVRRFGEKIGLAQCAANSSLLFNGHAAGNHHVLYGRQPQSHRQKIADYKRYYIRLLDDLVSGIGDSANGIEYSISVGVAELEYAEMSIESWYNLADTCLYASKQKGRNQTTLAPKKAMPCK